MAMLLSIPLTARQNSNRPVDYYFPSTIIFQGVAEIHKFTGCRLRAGAVQPGGEGAFLQTHSIDIVLAPS
jgi:hypothetical protein